MKREKQFRPDKIGDYFRIEWLPLVLVTVSGLIYNIGLLAAPWFEGRLAQCLADILGGNAAASAMAMLVLAYILVTLLVQAARFIKRFYVRRFANNINRRMKGVLYANLVRQSRAALEKEGAGELMTKAISDVDDCVEGMRKFTTEVFDTGVALVGYIVMLLVYDWRLALLSLLFTPVSYVCAAGMKKPVQREGAAYKKATGALRDATLDRARNAATYRNHGCETAREERYEDVLKNYERTAVRSMSGSRRCRRSTWLCPRRACCLSCGSAQKCLGRRLVRLEYCRVHDVFVLLHETGRQVIESCKALQLRPKSRGFLAAHQAADEAAGAAGSAGGPSPRRRDAGKPLLRLRRRTDFCRAYSDGAPRRYHRHHRSGRLR